MERIQPYERNSRSRWNLKLVSAPESSSATLTLQLVSSRSCWCCGLRAISICGASIMDSLLHKWHFRALHCCCHHGIHKLHQWVTVKSDLCLLVHRLAMRKVVMHACGLMFSRLCFRFFIHLLDIPTSMFWESGFQWPFPPWAVTTCRAGHKRLRGMRGQGGPVRWGGQQSYHLNWVVAKVWMRILDFVSRTKVGFEWGFKSRFVCGSLPGKWRDLAH